MNKEHEIVNKVASSGIITLDLEQLIPEKEIAIVDVKEQLFQGLILKEKDFRAFVKEHPWETYQNKRVVVYCSTDAIIPTWAYMLLSKALQEHSKEIYFCHPDALPHLLAERAIAKINPSQYQDARVVIKGCGEREISNHAYVALSTALIPYVKSLMYGEPCSTVPIYKKPRV